ncbi:MAG: molybdate ABC transporter substrate-binding protein [Sedimenticola sp.]
MLHLPNKPGKQIALAIIMLLAWGSLSAAELRVAVASNFSDAIKRIAGDFEAATGHRVKLIFGSTGKHYAQIRNGAPFDLFFAADSRRPRLLEEEGAADPGSRFTYARGKVVLWSPKAGYVDSDGRVLENDSFRHLAIANPKLAPYGMAAREVLKRRGLWQRLQRGRMVRGENIAQTYQFVKSGNADLGFVAYAQVKRPGHPIEGSYWEVPQALYAPIEQQAVMVRKSDAARQFIEFIQQDSALGIIRSFGYDTPDAE